MVMDTEINFKKYHEVVQIFPCWVIFHAFFYSIEFTPGRRQSKTLLTIDEDESNIAKNSVFDYHLSPVGRKMAIKNSV